MTLNPFTFTRRAVLAAAASAALVAPVAAAAPVAYTERAFSVAGSYAITGGVLGGAVGVEFPFAVPLPGDYSVALTVRYAGAFSATTSAKVLLFPALGGNPPIALAFGLDATLLFPPGGVGFRVGLGPIVSVDLNPLVLSLSAFPSFGSGGFAADLGVNARYYFDPFAVELNFDYSTFGVATVGVGVRYLF